MSDTPTMELIARALVQSEGHLLLCKSPEGTYAYLPGGHIEPGEGARAALGREVQEEMGREAVVGRLIAVAENHYTRGEARIHEINLCFEVTIQGVSSLETPASTEERVSFDWVRMDGLEEAQLMPEFFRDQVPRWLFQAEGPKFGSNMEGTGI